MKSNADEIRKWMEFAHSALSLAQQGGKISKNVMLGWPQKELVSCAPF